MPNEVKGTCWAFWVGPMPSALLSRVRIRSSKSQTQLSDQGVRPWWWDKSKVKLGIRIKWVHGHGKRKAVADLEISTLAVLQGEGLMDPGWAEKAELCRGYLWGPQVSQVRPLRSISALRALTRLSRKPGESSCQEVFKSWLEKAQINHITVFEKGPALSRELEYRLPTFCANLGYSVILQSLLVYPLY